MFFRNKYVLFGALALVVLGAAALFLFPKTSPRSDGSLTPAAASFVEQVQAKTARELGHLIDGVDRSALMEVYPGFLSEDFEGVETLGGRPSEPITSRGMGTLLENIARRAQLPLATEADITTIIAFMDRPAAGGEFEPQRASLTGTFVCLPHVNTEGPQTMECAFGIKLDDGTYYAVDFALMSQVAPNIPTGKRFSANGVITPVERLSTDNWRKYPIKGIFSVTDSVTLP